MNVDVVVVDRLVAGRVVKATKEERLAAVAEMLRRGRTTTDIAVLLRLSAATARTLVAAATPQLFTEGGPDGH